MNIFPTIEMMGYDAGKPAFAGSPQSAQADFLFSIAHDFNRGTNVGVTENYAWNADGTLASFPGPGYTRLLEYDEEGRLIRIRRDYGNGNVQLAYEYAYGFDGGRRWRKDYINGVWTRYPCGVACGAGDLVEQQKPLEGGSWTTTALYLQGISLVRRNGEWHHFDPLGTAGVITNSSASVISNNLYDVFGVLRYEQGSTQTPCRWTLAQYEAEAFIVVASSVWWNGPSATLARSGTLGAARYYVAIPWLWLLMRAVLACAAAMGTNELLNPNPSCFSRCTACCGGVLAGALWKLPPFARWDPIGKLLGGGSLCMGICRGICSPPSLSPSPPSVDTSQYPGRYTVIPTPYERVVWY